jgi:hypothetical protein
LTQEQDNEIIAIDLGLEEAQTRCKNVGAVLGEILEVEEVPSFELEDEPAEEGEEEEEEEEEAEVITYKFVVSCIPKGKGK